MTREEAEEYAKVMTYREAIYNFMKARSIPYRKATFIKVNELLNELEQEPQTGHWIMTGDYYTGAYGSIDYVECSCCHEYSLEEGDYCPNCGCRMIEPQESENKE